MTQPEANHNSHYQLHRIQPSWYASTSVRIRTLIFRVADANRLGCVAEKSQSPPVLFSFVSKFVALSRGGLFQCTEHGRSASRAHEKTTDRICTGVFPTKFLNENNPQARTEMSNRSASATSPSWPTPTRLKLISRFSGVLMLVRRAAGWLTTTNRQPKSSASSSAKSCVVSTSARKRRAF